MKKVCDRDQISSDTLLFILKLGFALAPLGFSCNYVHRITPDVVINEEIKRIIVGHFIS